MTDPRLNSIHLEAPRREMFRRARELLLNSRGQQTMMLEEKSDSGPSNTIIQKSDAGSPTGLECWLMDRDYLYPLKVGLNTIGRAPENDVVVADGYVSRRHCAIVVHATRGCELHDVASKNGTFLNGKRISGPTLLRPGDEIRLCDRTLVFVTQLPAGKKPPSSTIGV